MKTWLISVSVAAALLSGGVQASDAGAQTAADAASGEARAAVCVACHGPMGNSVNPVWPKLAGQHPDYIYKQLMDFKSGARTNDMMSPQVLTLEEQDFRNLAAYFASQQQTAGAARQWNGNRGKVDNCVVAVHLSYAAPGFQVLLDSSLYLPEAWANDAGRRKKRIFPTTSNFAPSRRSR